MEGFQESEEEGQETSYPYERFRQAWGWETSRRPGEQLNR